MASTPALGSTSHEVGFLAGELESPSRWTFLAFLLGVYLLGFLTFPCLRACLCWCCCRPRALQSSKASASSCTKSQDLLSSSSPSPRQAAELWQNLVRVGLRLVHKRHRASISFKALEAQATLRQAKGSKPSAARQRHLAIQRVSRGSTPIKEGPVFSHGSDNS